MFKFKQIMNKPDPMLLNSDFLQSSDPTFTKVKGL